MGMIRIAGGILSILQMNVPVILFFGLLGMQVATLLLGYHFFNIAFLGLEVIPQFLGLEGVAGIFENRCTHDGTCGIG